MQRVFTYLIPSEVQEQTVDVVKGVDVNPSFGVPVCLGTMRGRTTVDACHIEVCILSGDLHIFVCTYFMLVKNFSHLNMVLSGYPDKRRPI